MASAKGIRYACTDFPLTITNKTSDKKQRKEKRMTSKQRAYLKSLSSTMDPIFQIGKGSLTPEVTEAVGEAFHNRELIKVGVLKNCADDPKIIAQALAERTHSQVVHVIGKKIVLYKENKDNKKIILPL